MPAIDQLVSSEEQSRNERLQTQIKSAWTDQKVPDRDMIIAVGGIDTNKLINYFYGKRFDELPFENGAFCTESPFSYMTAGATAYYIGGYMLNALRLALLATQNEWGGMGLEVIVTLAALTESYDHFQKLLSTAQKQSIFQFLQFVHDHTDFFFWKDKVDRLESVMRNIGG
jgi:hypothetical protein